MRGLDAITISSLALCIAQSSTAGSWPTTATVDVTYKECLEAIEKGSPISYVNSDAWAEADPGAAFEYYVFDGKIYHVGMARMRVRASDNEVIVTPKYAFVCVEYIPDK